MKKEIIVIRLSSRAYRDLRITTHCCLVARAFGAEKIYLSNDSDTSIVGTVDSITERFGGKFSVEYFTKLKPLLQQLKKQKYTLVHLTMYGEKLSTIIPKIKKMKKIAIIVGADKVPREVYEASDYNVGVTNQPHSEVGALAVFMHECMQGKEEMLSFAKAKLKVVPTAKGKHVTRI